MGSEMCIRDSPTTDNYIWFYQIPFKFEREKLIEEIVAWEDKLDLLLTQIPSYKNLIVISLVDLAPFRLTESDWSVYNVIERYNRHIQELSGTYPNVKVLDFSDFTSRYSSEQLVDWRFYFISQMSQPQIGSGVLRMVEGKDAWSKTPTEEVFGLGSGQYALGWSLGGGRYTGHTDRRGLSGQGFSLFSRGIGGVD